ncbi:MAG: hypothetical protein HYY16_11005 [Planctomycetes bacterium]|nr:hypothetical protein [Planctomycetota bacterium]
MNRVICKWCAAVVGDGRDPAQPGICDECIRKLERREILWAGPPTDPQPTVILRLPERKAMPGST